MNNWSQVSLQEVCKITRGASPRPIKDWITNDLNGIPWVKISDATSSKTRFIKHTSEMIKQEGISKSVSVVPGDLIVSNSATPGLPKFMDINACIHDGWLLIREFDGIDKEFLYYLLINDRKYLVSQGTGTVFTNLKTDILKNHIIQLPNIKVQKIIASFLSKLDSKIELNQKINETLEEIAKTLFKSWFIDFDPVRAKAEGRSTGLSKEISDLFPDSFEDSELGQIPEGFIVDSVDNQYDISIGKTPPRKEPQWFSENQQDIPWASIKDMGDAGVYINKTSEFLTNEAIEKFNIRVIPKNNVILSFKLTVGRVSILQKDMCTNEAIAHFVPKDNDLSMVFTYCLLKSIRYESLSSTSSIATAVNSKIIKAMKCIFPSKALLIAFNEFCRPIYKKIETNTNEIETLSSLRDVLLPKLISGELKIPDAENLVDEAGV